MACRFFPSSISQQSLRQMFDICCQNFLNQFGVSQRLSILCADSEIKPVKTTGLTDTIPWSDILSTPYRFYQTTIFCFPVPLCSPQELSNVHAILIAEFLGKVSSESSETPFVFFLDPDAKDPLCPNPVPDPVVPAVQQPVSLCSSPPTLTGLEKQGDSVAGAVFDGTVDPPLTKPKARKGNKKKRFVISFLRYSSSDQCAVQVRNLWLPFEPLLVVRWPKLIWQTLRQNHLARNHSGAKRENSMCSCASFSFILVSEFR